MEKVKTLKEKLELPAMLIGMATGILSLFLVIRHLNEKKS
jgi:hypothetical protein